MRGGFPGLGTVINVATVVIGSLLGMAMGHRLSEAVRLLVTDCLGLTTLLVAGVSAWKVTDASLTSAVGSGAPDLIVLASLVIGAVTGSLMRIEARLEGVAGVIQATLARRPKLAGAVRSGEGRQGRERFIEGWLSASLLFCVGPLTILGSLSDGFAAVAFASSYGVGVLASALSVALVQGLLTALGVVLGSILPDAHIAALTATGGLLLVGISLRLLRVRQVPVGDMLPALIVAPLLTQLVVMVR